MSARPALAKVATLTARSAAHFLFLLRSLPFAAAFLITVGICLPSYLWFEPLGLHENVSAPFLVLGWFGAAELGLAIGVMSRAAFRSVRFLRQCGESGTSGDGILIIESARPFLALAGILRPRVVMSQGILDLLSTDELHVVLKHEEAHRQSHDNLKRLWIELNPTFPSLERAWTRFTEYAADERAVAGDQRSALALASALVRVSRYGQQAALQGAIPFLGDINDVPSRVERLLAPQPSITPDRTRWRDIVVALCLAALTLNPATLRFVQSTLESLIR
jgi:Zn-dependent protease with chaperone function